MTQEYPEDEWKSLMTQSEVDWCLSQINFVLRSADEEDDFFCNDNWRAAKMSDNKQMELFKELSKQGCCGSHEWISSKWNWKKLRFEKFILGFNHGH